MRQNTGHEIATLFVWTNNRWRSIRKPCHEAIEIFQGCQVVGPFWLSAVGFRLLAIRNSLIQEAGGVSRHGGARTCLAYPCTAEGCATLHLRLRWAATPSGFS